MLYEAIGLACIGVALAVLAAMTVAVVLRAIGLQRRASAMRARHAMLDTEWLNRRIATLSALADSSATLVRQLGSLTGSLTRIAASLVALSALSQSAAHDVERLLDESIPWLRGIFE